MHFTSPAQSETLHLFPWSAMLAVVLACFFTIPAELLMIRMATGTEHGRVYANVGGGGVSDPDYYVTVGVMFYFSVVFFIHEIYIRRRKQWCLRFTVCNFHVKNLLFNAKVNTVFHSMTSLMWLKSHDSASCWTWCLFAFIVMLQSCGWPKLFWNITVKIAVLVRHKCAIMLSFF